MARSTTKTAAKGGQRKAAKTQSRKAARRKQPDAAGGETEREAEESRRNSLADGEVAVMLGLDEVPAQIENHDPPGDEAQLPAARMSHRDYYQHREKAKAPLKPAAQRARENRIAQWEHDMALGEATQENFQRCEAFLHACQRVAKWRIMQGEPAPQAAHFLRSIMRELAALVRELVEAGDVLTARDLAGVRGTYEAAEKVFDLDKNNKPRPVPRDPDDRLNMALAILGDNLTADEAGWLRNLKAEPLAAFLCGDEPERHPDGDPERLGQIQRLVTTVVENVTNICKQGDTKARRMFAEFLWRGVLWGGPDKTFRECPWLGMKRVPARTNAGAWWTRHIGPFLKKVTAGDPGKLAVWQHWLATRKGVNAGDQGHDRLATDDATDVWNQLGKEVQRAWTYMAEQADNREMKNAVRAAR